MATSRPECITVVEQDVEAVLTEAMIKEEKACHTTFEQDQAKEKEKVLNIQWRL